MHIVQALLYGHVAADYLVDKLPGGDLSFGDWSARLARTPLGRDLWLRHFLALRFFGPARGFYEDALLALPSFLDLGVRYFAGARLSRGELLELGARASLRLFRERHRSPLDGLDPPTETAAVRPAVTPYS